MNRIMLIGWIRQFGLGFVLACAGIGGIFLTEGATARGATFDPIYEAHQYAKIHERARIRLHARL